jgi:streptogramin lyase
VHWSSLIVPKLQQKFLKAVAVISLFSASVLPLRAETTYLFVGDRVANPGRGASVHRFTFDSESPTVATLAPAPGLNAGLWGGGNDAQFKGLDLSGMAMGPDGDIYAVSNSAKKVVRFDGKTGVFKGDVLTGLNAPDGLAIGPDGNLYIADGDVIRRCKRDGTPVPGAEQIGNTFTRGGGIATASGLTFGPDGNLYVASQNWQRILRYDGKGGGFMGVFHKGGVQSPSAMVFGPDGNLYVASIAGPGFNAESGFVAKIDGKTGDLLSKFAPDAKGALGLAFGPNGNLFVSNYWDGKITQYDGKTGASLGVFATNPDGSAFYSLVFANPNSPTK